MKKKLLSCVAHGGEMYVKKKSCMAASIYAVGSNKVTHQCCNAFPKNVRIERPDKWLVSL